MQPMRARWFVVSALVICSFCAMDPELVRAMVPNPWVFWLTLWAVQMVLAVLLAVMIDHRLQHRS